MEAIVDFALLTLLALLAVGIVRLRSLFGAAMLFGIYSLLCAAIFVVLDAVDVAFTEAAVGAGISTILILGTLSITGAKLEVRHTSPLAPLMITTVIGVALIYASIDMPLVGDPNAPANLHIAPEYIEGTRADIHIPNVVTAVLASYRGYDTLGETAVIFTAGLGVIMILGGARRVLSWQERDEEEDEARVVEVDDFRAAPSAQPIGPPDPEDGWDATGQTAEPPEEEDQ